MNNTQLYLSIGIPSFLVVLAWFSNKADINSNADKLEGKIEKLGESLRSEMNGLRKEIYGSMVPLHERMAVLETKQK